MAATIGPFEIVGELGRGAMAVVWRGYDPNLERDVAIKEPAMPANADETTAAEFAARFVREGKAAAALNHPGIVTIYGADVYDGRPAIIMELIEGETLATILERGPLTSAAAMGILDQLLEAAGYAHSRGVVHRDIKPDNVFVTNDGRVKLADFGIAHVGTTATLTQAGTVMGTPGYMAPEQVTGSPVDARADVFAIGAIAYEMLTGRNPFGATDGAPPTTVMYRIVHEQPPALPSGALAGLPLGFPQVIGAALAKDPSGRFASAEAFRAALRGGAVPTAMTYTEPAGARLLGQQNPVASNGKMAYIAVALVGVLGVGGMLMMSGVGGGGAVGGPMAATADASSAPEMTVRMQLSPDGADVAEGDRLYVEALPSDAAAVSSVAVYVDGVVAWESSEPPFSADIDPGSSGDHEVWVKVTDTSGRAVESDHASYSVLSAEDVAHSEIEGMLQAWNDGLMALDLNAHMDCYGDSVDYFKSGWVASSEIYSDKGAALAKYSSASGTLSNISITMERSDYAVVELDKSHSFSGPAKNWSARVRQRLGVERQGDAWKIVSERDIHVY